MNYKQRMILYIPFAIIAILGIIFLPFPYNKWITTIMLGLYWIVLMVIQVIYKKKKDS